MENVHSLNDAFHNFTVVSRNLEQSYMKLQEKINHLAMELEEKNKQLKKALNETEEAKDFLKGVLYSMREAIVVTDSEKKISMFNKAAENLLLMNSEDVIGKPLEGLGLLLENEGTDTFLTVNNKRYSVFISHSDVIAPEGALRGHVLLIQDITRIKELENQQGRNKRLIAMGEMAAKIVHEIRSPLCSIELYATMLEKEIDESGPVNLASGISTGIRSLNNILTNMLFFAKPQRPSFTPIDLDASIEETLFMLMPIIEARNIVLDNKVETPAQISGDRELIKQVIMNIILNAVQVTSEGGKIIISNRSVEGFEVVEITDEGEGIEHENIEKIFDPFFSTKDKGTGLGLAIASKIMQGHGGMINVDSDPGEGSCFQLYFPVSENFVNTGAKDGAKPERFALS